MSMERVAAAGKLQGSTLLQVQYGDVPLLLRLMKAPCSPCLLHQAHELLQAVGMHTRSEQGQHRASCKAARCCRCKVGTCPCCCASGEPPPSTCLHSCSGVSSSIQLLILQPAITAGCRKSMTCWLLAAHQLSSCKPAAGCTSKQPAWSI